MYAVSKVYSSFFKNLEKLSLFNFIKVFNDDLKLMHQLWIQYKSFKSALLLIID